MKKFTAHKLFFFTLCVLSLFIVVLSASNIIKGNNPTRTHLGSSTASQMPWRTLYTFSGNGDQVTKLFTMQGHWRIVWSCKEETTMWLNTNTFAFHVSSPEEPGVTIANVNCPNEGVSDIYMTDDVFLQITSKGDWKVAVEKQ